MAPVKIMIRSLRLRLLLMTVIVSGVAVAAVGLLSSRVTSFEFQRFVGAGQETSLERFREVLTGHYRQTGSWTGVQSVLERIGQISGRQLIMFDEQRKPIAAWPADLLHADIVITPDNTLHLTRDVVETGAGDEVGRQIRMTQQKLVFANPAHLTIANSQGAPVATLYLAGRNSPGDSNEQESFVTSVNRSLLLAALIAGGAAVLAAFLLSRRILGPVEALTEAARRMGQGDLSRRVEVRSRDEIGDLAQAFNGMADSLARVEQLRRNMIGDIAHELRSPLTNIRCQIETLQDGLAAPSPEIIASIHEEAMLLNRLIEDLQDLALAEAGQLRLQREPVDLRAVIDQAVNAMRRQAISKEIILSIEVQDDLPPVIADPERAGQVLRNLLANAITHAPAQGRIEIGALKTGAEVEVTVIDSGPGIAPEHLPFVFERFYRADDSRTRSTGGAGLGLAIVKQLVEAQGGRVWVKSERGKGSCFGVVFLGAQASLPAPGRAR
jgi:signal transduction histidine kinase